MQDQSTPPRGTNWGLIVWGYVLTFFLGLIGLAIVVFGEHWKRADRLKGAALAIVTYVVLAVVIIAAASSGGSTSTTVKTSNTSKPADTPRPGATAKATNTPKAQPTASLPANEAQIGNLLLTVNGSAEYSDDIFPAEAGTHYVAVDVTTKNTGDKNYSLNVLNFKLKDSDKFTGSSALTHGPEPKIGASDMVPGQEVRGFIVFKLGAGRTPVELQYQSFTGTAGTIPVQ